MECQWGLLFNVTRFKSKPSFNKILKQNQQLTKEMCNDWIESRDFVTVIGNLTRLLSPYKFTNKYILRKVVLSGTGKR